MELQMNHREIHQRIRREERPSRSTRLASVAAHRRGSVLLYSCFLVVALTAIASLGVDYGHVQLVKTELQICVDASARAGVAQLSSNPDGIQISNASTATIAMGLLNPVDNQPQQLLSTDVEVGNWDSTQTPAFSVSRSPANAVRVTGHRTAARGDPVQLILGAVIGAFSCDVNASAVAAVAAPMSNYGIVGIDHLNFSSLGVLARVNGDVASNGDINIGNPLGLLVSVTGNATSYSGYVTHGALAGIGGSQKPLSSSLNYPPVLVPGSNDNANISGFLDNNGNFDAVGIARVPSGTYVVHDLNVLADLDLDLEGPVTFYVTGSFNVAAAVNLLGNPNSSPSNFNVMVADGGSVNFLASILTPLKMNLYAPQSAINISVGVNAYTGELIGKTLDVNLPVLGSFTEVKPTPGAQVISLVQ
jgi:Flp pilus assembly protein TadG